MAFKTGKSLTLSQTAVIVIGATYSEIRRDGDSSVVVSSGAFDAVVSVSCGGVLAQVSVHGQGTNAGSTFANVATISVDGSVSAGVAIAGGDRLSGYVSVTQTVDEVFEILDPGIGAWFGAVPDSPAPSRIRVFLQTRPGTTRVAELDIGGVSRTVTHAVTGVSEIGNQVNMSASLTTSGAQDYEWQEIHQHPIFTNAGFITVEYSVPFYIPLLTVEEHTTQTDIEPIFNLSSDAVASVSGSEMSISTGGTNASGQTSLVGIPQTSVSLSGVIRAMAVPYTGSLSVIVSGIPDGSDNMTQVVSASGGAFALSGVQQQYSVNVVAGSTVRSANKSTVGPISCGIVGSDLVTNGDEPALTRLLMRGSLLSGVTISQVDSFNLFGTGGVSCAWSAGAVTVGGVATLAPGSCSLVFTPRVSALSYRYLRISVRSVGAANVALSVSVPPNSPGIDPVEISGGGSVGYEDVYSGAEEATKIWDIVTGADGSWVDADLDLCLPRNMASIGSVDGQDTRFPLPMRMPKFYGVSRITSLDIAGVPSAASGQTVQVRLVYFVRKGGAGASITDYLPTFYPNRGRTNVKFRLDTDWDAASAKYRPTETLDAGTTVEYYQRRMFSGRCDGKATIDESDFGYTKTTTTDDVTYSFSGPSISGFAAAVNASDAISVPASGHITRYPGITATVTAPTASATGYAHDDYFNRNLPATFLCGAGAWFDPTSGWNFGLDMAQGAVPAQPLYDSISVYGGCGDVFGHAGGGDTLVLKAAAILRGGGHALVWGATGSALPVPVGGRGVRVSEGSPATDGGHDVTGAADGYARTTDPWLHAKSVQVLVTPAGGGPAEWTFTAPFGTMYGQRASGESSVGIVPWSRRRVRGAFVVDLGGGHWVSMDVSPTGRLAQATTNTAGLIVLRLAVGFLVGTFSDIVTSISGNRPCCVFARGRSGGELILVYESGGAILRRATPDEGGSFTMAVTVSGTGAFPALCITPTGAEAFAWVTSGGAVMVRVLSAFGTQMLAPTAAVASGAAQDAVAILCRADGGLVLAYNGAGGIITVSSSDGGKTWA